MVSHDFNMTSFSPCCHNWLGCICFCVCICLLSRIFYLACYLLCVEQWLAFHWDISLRHLRHWVISGPYFPAFGLNTKRYFVSLHIQSECKKMRTRNNSIFGHFLPSNILTMKSNVVWAPTVHLERPDLYCWKRCHRVLHITNEFWSTRRKEIW